MQRLGQEAEFQEQDNRSVKKNRKPTLAVARRLIKKGNHGIKNLKVSWAHKPTWCEMLGNRGEWYWSSVVHVSAAGCRTRNMTFTADKDGRWIR